MLPMIGGMADPKRRFQNLRHRQATIVACAFALPGLQDAQAQTETGRVLLQVTPATDFGPSDGRAMDVAAWRINTEIARDVMAALNKAQPLVIDYEHQTLHAAENGQPAPAAGWIHALRWVPGRGLFAEAELTERARELISTGEYRYFSPVLEYEKGSGTIKRILMGALTNNPAIHGMQAIDLLAAASARIKTPDHPNHQPTEHKVNLLEKLLAALGLPKDTDEDAALAACNAIKAQADAAREALKLADDADAAAVVAACTALGARTTPDPTQFVPVTVVNELQTNIAALTARQQARDIEDAIAPALADGRLLPAEEVWARETAQTADGLAALNALLAVRKPIAALTGTQTQGKAPEGDAPADLSADELAVAAACGITPEQFVAARAA